MADPSFEPGRPGEFAIELGRVIDRGLRESKAVDMESLCVIAGKTVWAVRIDLHILDNVGNLIDAANIAALASLLTFLRPECTLGGENNQEVIIHDPEVREPLPLIIHHLTVAVSFAIFGEGNTMVIDPAFKEEAVMGGRLTATLNSNSDVCAIQKAGGGVIPSVIMQCLRVASMKAAEISEKIKSAADGYNMERALQKVKRHQSMTGGVIIPDIVRLDKPSETLEHEAQMFQNEPKRAFYQVDNMAVETSTSLEGSIPNRICITFTRSTEVVPGPKAVDRKEETIKVLPDQSGHEQDTNQDPSSNPKCGDPCMAQQSSAPKSLKDAVKLKGRKKSNIGKG